MSHLNPNTFDALITKAAKEGIEKFVVGTVVIKSNALLIVFRADHEDFLPGYAEIPGGGVDDGETLIDALYRETKEFFQWLKKTYLK